jgi:hypothetical protein
MEPMTLVLVAGAIIALAGGGYLFMRLQGRRREAAAAFHHFRCPGCQRRLRFNARQVGHKGECAHCGHEVTFPLVSQSVD